jgi:hypothetical protein
MNGNMQGIHVYCNDTDTVRMARFLERTGTFAQFCGHDFDERGTYLKMGVNEGTETANLVMEYILKNEIVQMVTVV